jgi:hypothetical protein
VPVQAPRAGSRFIANVVAAALCIAGNARPTTLVTTGKLGTTGNEAVWHDEDMSPGGRRERDRIRVDMEEEDEGGRQGKQSRAGLQEKWMRILMGKCSEPYLLPPRSSKHLQVRGRYLKWGRSGVILARKELSKWSFHYSSFFRTWPLATEITMPPS